MQDFFKFIANHWIMFSALIVVVVLIILEEARSSMGGVKKIPPSEVTHLINREDAVVIDIRDKAVFSQGHIIGARNIPVDQFGSQLKKLEKAKSRPIITVCAVGQSSIPAAMDLHKKGFAKVFSLAGGMKAWREAGLPTVKE